MSARRSSLPLCEACGSEPATSFSWFGDRARWYEPSSGTWQFTGACTTYTEQYYVLLRRRRYGWLDSQRERDDWIRHLRTKVWFNERDFWACVGRFEAARAALMGR